ncbi:hypothetical protein B0T22DRAFT_481704 [Podospora appendiculata]|uniref:SSCRP protein n=1 Tax=Podospora appendiculata TaxID=314037 RepID=A0AAE0XDC1_9PEZI|nr:hypothetical protein B0T22DRAFT_481704 [Podospora appendiculata]
MLFQYIFALLPAVATAVYGVPTELVHVERRGGDHHSVVYDGDGCSGDTLDTQINFGCGGTCHQVSNIQSVLLVQATTGNPKPTADFFASSDCTGSRVLHAGIFSGEHSGCSDMPSTANSYYLYYNC